METEVWPNLIAVCAERGVAVALVNARLSERSLQRAGRFGSLMTDAARAISLVAAQTEADAERVRSLGVTQVEVTGSIKFDVVVPAAALETGALLRARIGARPVLLCASTREGEEALILDAFRRLPSRPAGMLLLIVPRHPQRFDDVARLVQARGLALARRSEDGAVAPEVRGDAGRLDGRDVRLLRRQRLRLHRRQPAAAGRAEPDRSLRARQAGADRRAHLQFRAGERRSGGRRRRAAGARRGHMLELAAGLLRDDAARAAMGQRAAGFANRHRGATARTVELLQPLIY